MKGNVPKLSSWAGVAEWNDQDGRLRSAISKGLQARPAKNPKWIFSFHAMEVLF
jgi:hypothetical protein